MFIHRNIVSANHALIPKIGIKIPQAPIKFLFQKGVVRRKFDIYVLIAVIGSIYFNEDTIFLWMNIFVQEINAFNNTIYRSNFYIQQKTLRMKNILNRMINYL
jgi:hypothetical protein